VEAGSWWRTAGAESRSSLLQTWLEFSAMEFNTSCIDLATEKYVSLSTFRKTGVEVKTPVWIAPLGGRYYVFSAGEAGKVKRIRATSRVRLAACDMRGNLKSGWVDGKACIISDPTLIKNAREALTKKYGLMMRLTDILSSISGKIHRRAYIEIDLTIS